MHTRYRPGDLSELVGQPGLVRSLRAMFKSNKPVSHAFLLCGPSGVGKTTTARLIARAVGCEPSDILEIDAATHSGIENMREVTGSLIFRNLSGRPRMVIVDEAHALSKPAWQSLLKVLEEPPPDVYWCICTTEPNRIPATIETRCVCYRLREVGADDICQLLERVRDAEGMGVPDEVLDLIATNAGGSPRRALSYLALCMGCRTRKQASALLATAADEGEVIELCRALAQNRIGSWSAAMKYVAPLREVNAESVRLTVVGYFTSMALGAKNDAQAVRALAVLSAFEHPYPPQGFANLLLSLGRLVYEDEG